MRKTKVKSEVSDDTNDERCGDESFTESSGRGR